MCRTPFQLLLCQQIVAHYPDETAELLYATDIDGPKDRKYFEDSAKHFARRTYRVLRSRADILRFALLEGRAWRGQFSAIATGNHTLSHFRWIISRNPTATIRSFDEGSGNFHSSGELYRDTRTSIERLRDRILAIPPIAQVFDQTTVHYTVNALLKNVVPSERLQEVALFALPADATAAPVNVIIGQPLEEHLGPDSQTFFDAILALNGGHYVHHPREKSRAIAGMQLVHDDPRILEDYVADLIRAGHPVRLIGWYSTVFFTIHSPAVTKVYLHLGQHNNLIELAKRVGCTVFDLNHPDEIRRWHETAAEWVA